MEKRNYEIGDIVICVEVTEQNHENLVPFALYEVKGVTNMGEDIVYSVVNINTKDLTHTIDRFNYVCDKGDLEIPNPTETDVDDEVEDIVNKPKHYTQYRVDVIEIIEDACKSIKNGFHGWLLGNIIKYIMRFQFKNGVEDLKKAKFYLDKLINDIES